MSDLSHLDKKLFVDTETFNCAFCNRRNVKFTIKGVFDFDWNESKTCYGFITKCSSCHKESLHLSYEFLCAYLDYKREYVISHKIKDIDSYIFYSVPSTFYVMDERIPRIFRELITEAEGCMKMNFLTGASACVRKAIYEFTVSEKAEGEDYESKIKSLKSKYSLLDPTYFDILSHIQQMTSDKIHEQSWDKWDAKHLNLFLETLKSIYHEVYVVPAENKARVSQVQKVLEELKTSKKSNN